MTKEREILLFLYNNLFGKVLSSEKTTKELRKNIQDAMVALNDRSAEGMIRYFWSNIGGEESSKILVRRLEDEGFSGFEEVIEEFKEHFHDGWLRN